MFAFALARLISHVTRLSAGREKHPWAGLNERGEGREEKGRKTMEKKEKKRKEKKQEGKPGKKWKEETKRGFEKPLTLADGVLPQSGHVLQPCTLLSLSLCPVPVPSVPSASFLRRPIYETADSSLENCSPARRSSPRPVRALSASRQTTKMEKRFSASP